MEGLLVSRYRNKYVALKEGIKVNCLFSYLIAVLIVDADLRESLIRAAFLSDGVHYIASLLEMK